MTSRLFSIYLKDASALSAPLRINPITITRLSPRIMPAPELKFPQKTAPQRIYTTAPMGRPKVHPRSQLRTTAVHPSSSPAGRTTRLMRDKATLLHLPPMSLKPVPPPVKIQRPYHWIKHTSLGASINVAMKSVLHKSWPGLPALGHDSEFKRIEI